MKPSQVQLGAPMGAAFARIGGMRLLSGATAGSDARSAARLSLVRATLFPHSLETSPRGTQPPSPALDLQGPTFAKAAAYAVVRWHCPMLPPLTLGVEHTSRKLNSIPATVGSWCGRRCGRGDSVLSPASPCHRVPYELGTGISPAFVLPADASAWLEVATRIATEKPSRHFPIKAVGGHETGVLVRLQWRATTCHCSFRRTTGQSRTTLRHVLPVQARAQRDPRMHRRDWPIVSEQHIVERHADEVSALDAGR
jgi:hypothetical protein